MAYLMEKSERCTRCGTAKWEWEEDPFAYEAVHETCLGCQKLDLSREEGEKRPPGDSLTLIPRREAARLRAKLAESLRRRREQRERG